MVKRLFIGATTLDYCAEETEPDNIILYRHKSYGFCTSCKPIFGWWTFLLKTFKSLVGYKKGKILIYALQSRCSTNMMLHY